MVCKHINSVKIFRNRLQKKKIFLPTNPHFNFQYPITFYRYLYHDNMYLLKKILLLLAAWQSTSVMD